MWKSFKKQITTPTKKQFQRTHLKGVASSAWRQTSAHVEAETFAHKDPSCCDVLIVNGVYAGDDEMEEILSRIKSDFNEENASITSTVIAGEENTCTLSLPGYRIATMNPQIRWSRLRNHRADHWRYETLQGADSFVYFVNLSGSTEEYLNAGPTGNFSGLKKWERDRFELAQLLRSPHLVENPKKPLLLLVQNNDDDFDVERVTNLLGLNRLGRRPFNAVSYSADKTSNADVGILKEALGWLTKSGNAEDDESTAAITVSEPGEGGSVTASTTTTVTLASLPSSLGHYVLDYEPTLLGGNATLQRFQPIKINTYCPFARAAKLWGGKLPDEHMPRLDIRVDRIKEAATLNAGPLAEFATRSMNREALDGFCMEIPCSPWCDVEYLGEKIRGLLTALADLDPSPGENCMKKMGSIDNVQWRFRFAGEDWFITSFSPAYKEDSSRYSFGSTTSFLLFQPSTSFARHGMVEDTPASATNWKHPTTMRDKARVAFKQNGCPYHIPDTLPYPVAEHIVKPEKDDGTNVVRWWEPLKE